MRPRGDTAAAAGEIMLKGPESGAMPAEYFLSVKDWSTPPLVWNTAVYRGVSTRTSRPSVGANC